jgi:demethylmenaquinone methyltransferase/2-methoxy-6-polyprenyl-1,4-benzoquinol methylase
MTRVVPLVAGLRGRYAHARDLMRFYWDTIDACVPPADVIAALERAGLAQPTRGLVLGMFSEYTGRR